MHSFRLGRLMAAITLATGACTVAAQLEETVVTAQKRSQSMQDVPISIAAISGSELRDLSITRATDVLNFVPNASTHLAFGDSQFNFYIRGVGDSNFHVNSISSVGVYADEVSLNSPPMWGFAVFDLARVEVLRGPQNTLFGRNTTGGAVSFISSKPSLEEDLNGFANFTYGSHNRTKLEAALGMPVSDSVAIRLAILADGRDGIQDNVFLNETENDIERYAGRFQALWAPNDSFNALFNIHGGVNRGGNRRPKFIGTQDPNNLSLPCPVPLSQLKIGPPCVNAGGSIDNKDHLKTNGGMPNPINNIDVWGTSLKLDWFTENYTISSITSFEHSEMERSEDADGAPQAYFELHQGTDVDQFIQEFRIVSDGDTRLRWLAGAIYFKEEAYLPSVIRRTPPGPGDPPPNAIPGEPGANTFTVLPTTILHQDDESTSAYGQLDYDLTEKLTLTAGLRFSREEKTGKNRTFVGLGILHPFGKFLTEDLAETVILNDVGISPLEAKSDEWGGKLGLTYNLDEDEMVYASISRGYKAGGFSAAPLQALIGQAARQVEPEELLTYELGYKAEWLDNRLQTNMAVFYNDWNDMQIFSVLLEQGELLPLLLNVPETSSWGGEIEAKFVPSDGWLLQLGVGFLDTEVNDATNLPAIEKGNELPFSPGLSVDGLIVRDWNVGNGILTAQTDFHYVDDQTYDLANKAEFEEDGYFTISARIDYEFDKFKVGIFGRNLTEESFCDNKFDFRGGIANSLKCLGNDDEITWGIDLNVIF